MRASAVLEYAFTNKRELEPLVMGAGYFQCNNGRFIWFSDWGVELDLEHLIEQGIVKVEDGSKMSIYMPVHLLILEGIDVREYVMDVNNPTVEDCQLIRMVNASAVGEVRGLDLFGYKRMTNAYDEPSEGFF